MAEFSHVEIELATDEVILILHRNEAWQALGLKTAPVVMGVRTKTIEWDLVGVLRRGDEMRSVLVSWLNQNRP